MDNEGKKTNKTASSSEKKRSTQGLKKKAQYAAKSSNRFALALFRQTAQEKKRLEKNIFFSPWSTHVALSMAYEMARKKTKEQMRDVLSLPKETPIHDLHHALLSMLKVKKAYTLYTTQLLWGETSVGWSKPFQETLREAYQAPLRLLSFRDKPEQARQQINQEVARATENKIQNLLPPRSLTRLTQLVLTSCIYFLGEWKHRFEKEKTQAEPFFMPTHRSSVSATKKRGKETKILVQTMRQQGRFQYASTSRFHLVVLPYQGPMEMWLVLPLKKKGLAELEETLNLEELEEAGRELHKKMLSLYLPRFSIGSTFRFGQTLRKMGMTDAFSTAADFSGASAVQAKDLRLTLSEVHHKALVQVDERGSEAAAATGVVMGARSVGAFSALMKFNRPFLFMIRHVSSGTFLFFGRVYDPRKR